MGELSSTRHWDQVHAGVPGSSRRKSPLRRRVSKLLNRKLDAVLEAFLARTGRSDPRVLELGCAPGRMLEQLHRVRPTAQLSGIDYAEHGLELTARRLREIGVQAALHRGDIRSFEAPGRFDLVVSFGLVEHFDDPATVIASHARFAEPGGWVGITVPNLAVPVVERLARRFAPRTMATHNLAIMSPQALFEAMARAGLAEISSGGAGGPALSAAADPGVRFARHYRALARAWNLAAAVAPFDAPWQRTLWALGRVPA